MDAAFTDFVGSLDQIVRNGRMSTFHPSVCNARACGNWTLRQGPTVELRQKAVEVALAVTSGAYQTSLLTYLIQRDMFPSLTKVRPFY